MVEAKMVSIVCVCVCLSRCCRGCVWIAKKNSRYTICFFLLFSSASQYGLVVVLLNERERRPRHSDYGDCDSDGKTKILRRDGVCIRYATTQTSLPLLYVWKANEWIRETIFTSILLGSVDVRSMCAAVAVALSAAIGLLLLLFSFVVGSFFVCVLFLVRRCIITRCFYFHSRDIIHVHRMKNLIINMCVSIYYYYYLFIFFIFFHHFVAVIVILHYEIVCVEMVRMHTRTHNQNSVRQYRAKYVTDGNFIKIRYPSITHWPKTTHKWINNAHDSCSQFRRARALVLMPVDALFSLSIELMRSQSAERTTNPKCIGRVWIR